MFLVTGVLLSGFVNWFLVRMYVFLVTPVEPYSEFVKIIHFAKKDPFFIQLTQKFQKMYILSSRIIGC